MPSPSPPTSLILSQQPFLQKEPRLSLRVFSAYPCMFSPMTNSSTRRISSSTSNPIGMTLKGALFYMCIEHKGCLIGMN